MNYNLFSGARKVYLKIVQTLFDNYVNLKYVD